MSIYSAQRFVILCFAMIYYDICAITHDHVIGRLTQLARAFCMCMIRSRNTYYIPIHGDIGVHAQSPGTFRAINAILLKKTLG